MTVARPKVQGSARLRSINSMIYSSSLNRNLENGSASEASDFSKKKIDSGKKATNLVDACLFCMCISTGTLRVRFNRRARTF